MPTQVTTTLGGELTTACLLDSAHSSAARAADSGCLKSLFPGFGKTHMNIIRKKDLERTVTYIKAWLALYGSIVVWYGGWTQLDVGFSQLGYSWANGSAVPSRCIEAEVPYNPHRDVAYVLGGTGTLMMLDALYPNAGITLGGSLWPEKLRTPMRSLLSTEGAGPGRRLALRALGFARVIFALLASVTLWLGW
jgi:hypothetical protein